MCPLVQKQMRFRSDYWYRTEEMNIIFIGNKADYGLGLVYSSYTTVMEVVYWYNL